MTYKQFIDYNTAANTAKDVKHLTIGGFQGANNVSLYPTDIAMTPDTYGTIRSNIKIVTFTTLESQVKNKRWHISNPEAFAGAYQQ